MWQQRIISLKLFSDSAGMPWHASPLPHRHTNKLVNIILKKKMSGRQPLGSLRCRTVHSACVRTTYIYSEWYREPCASPQLSPSFLLMSCAVPWAYAWPYLFGPCVPRQMEGAGQRGLWLWVPSVLLVSGVIKMRWHFQRLALTTKAHLRVCVRGVLREGFSM